MAQPYIAPGGQPAYRKADGTGTELDPFVAHFIEQALEQAIGTQADVSSGTGSLMARIRELIERLGLYGDAASPTGSINAKLRKIAESNILHRPTAAQYYAGVDGGNVSFNTTAGVQSVNTSGGVISSFLNPSNSTVDCYIQRLVLSSDQPGRYERYRGGSITVTGSATTPNNRGGNTSKVAMARLYGRSAATATGGNLGMITYVGASNTTSDPVDGSIIIRPGDELHWSYFPNAGVSGNSNCAVEVVWWELPART